MTPSNLDGRISRLNRYKYHTMQLVKRCGTILLKVETKDRQHFDLFEVAVQGVPMWQERPFNKPMMEQLIINANKTNNN